MSTHQPTVDYYNANAEAFRKRTADCKVTPLYDSFLSLLKPGAHILDAGCGPGRDALVFLQRGFKVTAMDASVSMVKLATKMTGQPAILQSLQEIDYVGAFEGVWACASLLHVPRLQIDNVMHRIVRALRPGGALFISVKHGDGERLDRDGRLFCDYTVDSLRAVLARQPMLEIINVKDAPSGEINPQHWVYAIARKRVVFVEHDAATSAAVQTAPIELNYEPRSEFDPGLFVAKYLQVFGWISIVTMITGPFFTGRINIDFSFILFFWAASGLKKHNPIARRCVLFFSGLGLALCVFLLFAAVACGTGTVTINYVLGKFTMPVSWKAILFLIPAMALFGIPCFVLMSRRARDQFQPDAVGL